MVSVAVSKLRKTSLVFEESGAKVNSAYYCDHFLKNGLLPVFVDCQVTISRSNRMVRLLTDQSTRCRSCRKMFPTSLSRPTSHLTYLIWILWTTQFGVLWKRWSSEASHEQLLRHDQSRTNRWWNWTAVQTTIVSCSFSRWTHWAPFFLILDDNLGVNFVAITNLPLRCCG